jgi:hypothetical protein
MTHCGAPSKEHHAGRSRNQGSAAPQGNCPSVAIIRAWPDPVPDCAAIAWRGARRCAGSRSEHGPCTAATQQKNRGPQAGRIPLPGVSSVLTTRRVIGHRITVPAPRRDRGLDRGSRRTPRRRHLGVHTSQCGNRDCRQRSRGGHLHRNCRGSAAGRHGVRGAARRLRACVSAAACSRAVTAPCRSAAPHTAGAAANTARGSGRGGAEPGRFPGVADAAGGCRHRAARRVGGVRAR